MKLSDIQTHTPVGEFQAALEAWLRYRELAGDHHFYTHDEWVDKKGEFCCCNPCFKLHLVSEGGFCNLMNYGDDDECDKLIEEFDNLVEHHGYCYESGFSWSWHFYPEDAFDGPFTEADRQWSERERAGWRKHSKHFSYD